jgi:hypothetical protein
MSLENGFVLGSAKSLGSALDVELHLPSQLDNEHTQCAILYDQYETFYNELTAQYRELLEKRKAKECSPLVEASLDGELDTITDELKRLCEKLSGCRATTTNDLRLKAQALLCLLPDDDDPAMSLAESLCGDIIAFHSKTWTPGSTRPQ